VRVNPSGKMYKTSCGRESEVVTIQFMTASPVRIADLTFYRIVETRALIVPVDVTETVIVSGFL